MLLSLAIPCYNEQDNVPLIVARLKTILAGRSDVEVLLIDNGSSDETGTRIEREIDGSPFLRLVTVPVNKGYGYGIKAGLAQARGEVLAWTHADMQTDPQDVLVALDRFRAAAGRDVVVKGRRLNRRAAEASFTFGMQLLASAALGARLSDVNAQPKLFSRAFHELYLAQGAPDDFSLDLYMLYHARRGGYDILEVPVVFAERLHGEAKGGGQWRTRIKLIRRTFAYIFELRRSLSSRDSSR